MNRSLFIVLAAALGLRWTTALVTQTHPIFPPHYYTDAGQFHRNASTLAQRWSSGKGDLPSLSAEGRLYAVIAAGIYRAFGPHPIGPKLLNGLLSILTIWLWYRIASMFFPPACALWTAWALALWPSHIFFTSQNLKESWITLSCASFFFFCLRTLKEPEFRKASLFAAGCSLSLLITGFFRSYLVILSAAAVFPAAAHIGFRNHPEKRQALALCLALIGTILLYKPLYDAAFGRFISADSLYAIDPHSRASLTPSTFSPERPKRYVQPYSPEGISEFRRIRMSEDQNWAKKFSNRKIGTQIFPDARFKTWGDVLRFWPKGAFYALFMPLPGLYPMDGQLGRMAAAAENLLLLFLFLMGLWTLRSFWRNPPAQMLFAFFIILSASYGLLEFDLGSASRHRLQHLPCLFPFAAAGLERLLRRRSAQCPN
ncbi:MAG: hypothetical protein WCU88_02240 [Elusimicrobiota bacterium]|jgi:hypothetical protein